MGSLHIRDSDTQPASSIIIKGVGTKCRTAQTVVEGIFEDLIRGSRAEEALNHQRKELKVDTKRIESRDGVETRLSKVGSLYGRWLNELGPDLTTGSERNQLTDALVFLEAAYWLDRKTPECPEGPFYHPMLSNNREYPSTPLINYFGISINNSTIISDYRLTELYTSFTRCDNLAKKMSWKLLALLSLSPTFRSASTNLPDPQWQHLLGIFSQNKGSFELISRTTRPQYGALLVAMFRGLGIVENIIHDPSDAWMAMNNWIYTTASAAYDNDKEDGLNDPMAGRYLNHPQRWFVTVDKQSILPVDPVYFPIAESMILTQELHNDPRYIGGDCEGLEGLGVNRRKVCERCEAKEISSCNCTFNSVFPEPLVEIIETDGKGLGVRSLQTIRKGAILGEYAGLIQVDAAEGDVYSLGGHLAITDKDYYITSSQRMGNFTRFANHSCSPNCYFSVIGFRGRRISVLSAVEDINLFDEITADYGTDYFLKRGLECRCGTPECKISPRA